MHDITVIPFTDTFFRVAQNATEDETHAERLFWAFCPHDNGSVVRHAFGIWQHPVEGMYITIDIIWLIHEMHMLLRYADIFWNNFT